MGRALRRRYEKALRRHNKRLNPSTLPTVADSIADIVADMRITSVSVNNDGTITIRSECGEND